MGKGKQWLMNKMAGRYGLDKLYYILFGVLAVFLFLGALVSPWFYVPAWAVLIWSIFRVFSKNITKRKRENDKVVGFFLRQAHRVRDRKTKRYRKCPHCRVVLKLPYQKGRHMVRCPQCGNQFEIKL